jgi:SAM-dependent methyltransferase
VTTSLARTRERTRAHVIQADLLRLPLASSIFDGAHSFGVVHHTPDPARAIREISRTLKPSASLFFYVYEDFADRPWYWRAALALVKAVRLFTTRLPSPVLMLMCRALSPLVYVCSTLPAQHFPWAARFPYRHNAGPWDLSGDLYDRFAPPIEHRYSRDTAVALAAQAGLEILRVVQDRGWIVWARKLA